MNFSFMIVLLLSNIFYINLKIKFNKYQCLMHLCILLKII